MLQRFIHDKIYNPIHKNLHAFINKTKTHGSTKSTTSTSSTLSPSVKSVNVSSTNSSTAIIDLITVGTTQRSVIFTEIVPEVRTPKRHPAPPYFHTTPSPADSDVTTAGATAVMIIVICIILIIAICVIIIFLLWYRKAENNYKIDDRKTLSLQQEQKSVLLPSSERIQVYDAAAVGRGLNGKFKKRQDVKEWYV